MGDSKLTAVRNAVLTGAVALKVDQEVVEYIVEATVDLAE